MYHFIIINQKEGTFKQNVRKVALLSEDFSTESLAVPRPSSIKTSTYARRVRKGFSRMDENATVLVKSERRAP